MWNSFYIAFISKLISLFLHSFVIILIDLRESFIWWHAYPWRYYIYATHYVPAWLWGQWTSEGGVDDSDGTRNNEAYDSIFPLPGIYTKAHSAWIQSYHQEENQSGKYICLSFHFYSILFLEKQRSLGHTVIHLFYFIFNMIQQILHIVE